MKERLLGLLFMAVGVGLTIWGCGMMRQGSTSESWPTAEGTVVSSSVSSKSSSSAKRSSKRKYEAKVAYTYQVDGREYRSSRIRFGHGSSSSKASAQAEADLYAVGRTVEVRYDPDDPSTAVLEAGVSLGARFVPVGGLIFFLVGIGGLLGLGDRLGIRFGR